MVENLACRWLGATALADRMSALPAMEPTATVPMLRIIGLVQNLSRFEGISHKMSHVQWE